MLKPAWHCVRFGVSCYACEFLDLLPDLVVRGFAIYSFLYLQTLYVIAQRVVDPSLKVVEGYSIQYGIDITYLENRFNRSVILAPGAVLVVFNFFYYARRYLIDN